MVLYLGQPKSSDSLRNPAYKQGKYFFVPLSYICVAVYLNNIFEQTQKQTKKDFSCKQVTEKSKKIVGNKLFRQQSIFSFLLHPSIYFKKHRKIEIFSSFNFQENVFIPCEPEKISVYKVVEEFPCFYRNFFRGFCVFSCLHHFNMLIFVNKPLFKCYPKNYHIKQNNFFFLLWAAEKPT